MLLEKLCNLNGVSGNENAVRDFILAQIKPYADDITIDTMGSVIAFKKGEDSSKKVMLDAHMDEVGLIISGITEKGFLRFQTVGGIDTRVLISKRVIIGDKKISGVIGMKAIHLQTRDERESVPKIRDLYIDIGAESEKSAKKAVSLGDYAAFDTKYSDIGTDCVKAKALDDRCGCAVLIDALKHGCRYDLYCTFTVQEEVGLRGAAAATYRIDPDIALVLEATTCNDVFGVDEKDFVTVLGKGVAVSFMDRSTIVDKSLRDSLIGLAKSANIPVQLKQAVAGGNNAGIIHKSRTGIKTASLSVPCRYIHSPAGIIKKSDFDAMRSLTLEFLDKIDEVI